MIGVCIKYFHLGPPVGAWISSPFPCSTIQRPYNDKQIKNLRALDLFDMNT